MRVRAKSSAPGDRSVANSLDLVLCSPQGRNLTVLLVREGGRNHGQWALPWAPLVAGISLEDGAARCAIHALGTSPSWMTQSGAFGGLTRHPGGATVSVAFAAVTPETQGPPGAGAQWFPIGNLPPLAGRHHVIVGAALTTLRQCLETSPVAFRLLPPTFTLTELQRIYELLLDRRLHKASFRRALQAAFLVEPLAEWRSEGRGRPAQLFRYAPRRGRAVQRGVRFVVMGGGKPHADTS